MTTTSNPIADPIRTLADRLNVFLGLLFVLKNQKPNMDSALQELVDKINVIRSSDDPLIMAYSSLVIRDLTEWPSDGAMFRFGSFSATPAEYSSALVDIVARNAGWTVSQGYEAFETFLFDQAALYLYIHPDRADPVLRTKFDQKKKGAVTETEVGCWKRFVRSKYRGRNSEEILKLLRSFTPDIAQVEQHHPGELDLVGWHRAVSEVRHAVVHSRFIIKQERIATWPEHRRQLLLHFFPATPDEHARGLRLSLDYKSAQKALKTFAEYAFLIFKSLSKFEGYECSFCNLQPGKGVGA